MDQGHLAIRLLATSQEFAARPATRIRVGSLWQTRTFAQFAADARALAAHLVTLGIAPGDRVALFSQNRPEWSVADLAALMIRGVVVPIYPTSTPEQIRHILGDSGSTIALVEGQSELDRVDQVWSELPQLRRLVTFDAVTTSDERVGTLAALLGEASDSEAVDEIAVRLEAASADEVASIVYTSGTTGDPRGAMLTHRGFTYQSNALDEFFDITPEDHSLCFLPLSHAFERAWTFHVLMHGAMNTYASAKDVAEMLVLASPTLMVSVPRLFEKVVATARARVAKSAAKQKIFDWALRVGGQCQHSYRKGREPSLFWRSQLPLADKLVFSSIRDAMGGPKTVMACGGAPVRRDIEEFFSACGMLICAGYGLTETSPVVSFNAPDAFKFGTVGRPIAGSEIRIGAESEILYRAPNVMLGYWNRPELTAEVLDADGWLHTGDVGYVDTDGFLVITDRIKDLIVTSNGKNIAPGPIEGIIRTDPLFEQAVILGDNRPFLTLLVSPSMPHLEELAKQLQIAFTDKAELLSNPQIAEEIKRRVGQMTSKLAHHEQIRDLRVLLEEFTQDNGLLTPTLKVKRREVERRFAEMIDDMYARVAEFRKRDLGKGASGEESAKPDGGEAGK